MNRTAELGGKASNGPGLARFAELIGLGVGLLIWGAALHAAFVTPRPVTTTNHARNPIIMTSSPNLQVQKPLIPIHGDSLSVIGRVVDLDGQPVEGVAVFLREAKPAGAGDAKFKPVVTDRLGWFQFFNLTPGRYAFVAIKGHEQLSGVEIIPMLAHNSRLHVRIVLDVSSSVI